MKFLPTLLCAAALAASAAARADAVDSLRDFVREARTGRAAFTQTVISPDGAKKKTSSGRFEFARPNRFRFVYAKPYEQVIVGDGQKVWLHDVDLQQVTTRPMSQALGATPAALLAGGSLDKDFDLAPQPPANGLEWAKATPKAKDGQFQSLRVGFKGKALAALEIVDSFGQTSSLQFSDFATNVELPADAFRFTPPKGVEVVAQ